jgi:hypothetical protein
MVRPPPTPLGIYKRKGRWEVRFTISGVKCYRHVPEAADKAQALVRSP